MARKREDEPTLIDAFAPALLEDDSDRGSGEKTLPRADPCRRPMPAADSIAYDANLDRVAEDGPPLLELGAEDHFILAWGRANAAVKSRGRQLLMSGCLNVVLVGAVAFLAWRNEQKETYVFVRDALGNVIQADANSFLHAGDSRTEAEIKGFVR